MHQASMDNQRLKKCGSQPTHRLSYRPMCAKELYCKVKKRRAHNRKSSARHILPCALLFVHISFINPCYNYDIIQYRKRTPHWAPCMLKRCWAPAWCSPVILTKRKRTRPTVESPPGCKTAPTLPRNPPPTRSGATVTPEASPSTLSSPAAPAAIIRFHTSIAPLFYTFPFTNRR